ncbi:AAA family ATPase [Paenibacillus doosanensis]|uniref:AAA family ATPase n=1 Tax=Paenibacillus doosanensis TaxID=1229154 RepID=UPI002180559C|nr:AAA family ATPase [Paenibacillus doosanensis]MCS7464166.1 AAA family ATPase [Paenibacillus doosanensis]
MYLQTVTLMRERLPDTEREQYPFSIPSIRTLNRLSFESPVTFFVGENGSGKSTLLEAIAYQAGFNTAGGGVNNRHEAEASGSVLGPYLRLSWMPKVSNGFFLRAESFYQFASHLDELSKDPLEGYKAYRAYGNRSLHEQSHGESFFALFQHRFGKRGVYLLDEPEAALSSARQLAFLRRLHELAPYSQFIIATHSPILMGYPDAQIYEFDSSPIRPVRYEDTPHYEITKGFLNHREQYLHRLFED